MDPLEAGNEAVRNGDWPAARAAFERAIESVPSPEAYEGLGLATFWLEDADAAIGARESAFKLYRRRGDWAGAARQAILLADDYFTFRGQRRVSSGWLSRARRLLEGRELSPEHGMLASEAGFIALTADHDMQAALGYGAEAFACGRALGIIEVEMYGLALQGLGLVSQGNVDQGMALLDEATAAATGGELTDLAIAGVICCYVIFACEWVHDFGRAAEWCERVKAFCERWQLSSLLGICRAHYGSVLTSQGAWADAEEQLVAASGVLASTRPVLAVEARVRLGELRRRQGRLDEAEALFASAAIHPNALLGKAGLALDRGELESASELARRFLRRLSPVVRAERIPGLEILVRASLRLGQRSAAEEAASELGAIARGIGTAPLLAAHQVTEALLAAGAGRLAEARAALEDAADALAASNAPYEAARARLDLAEVLRLIGRKAESEFESARAAEILEHLRGAETAIRASAAGDDVHGLTPREREVLALIAAGLSNHDVAEHLVLSVRTVERHISTLYSKLSISGKAARAAATAFAIRNGLA